MCKLLNHNYRTDNRFTGPEFYLFYLFLMYPVPACFQVEAAAQAAGRHGSHHYQPVPAAGNSKILLHVHSVLRPQ